METYIHDTYVSVNGIQVWPPSWGLITAVAAAVAIFAVAIAALVVWLRTSTEQ